MHFLKKAVRKHRIPFEIVGTKERLRTILGKTTGADFDRYAEDANLSSRDLAGALGITPQTAVNKVNRGTMTMSAFLKTAEACGATVTVTTKSGLRFDLTEE